MKGHHINEEVLALYAGGDLGLIERMRTALHLRGCGRCSDLVASHKAIRQDLSAAPALPMDSIDWERLSEEMTANIRLGISAAECVGPVPGERTEHGWWKPVLVASGAFVLLTGAFILNMPLERVAALWANHDQTGMVLESTAAGIEVRQDGRAVISVRHPDRKSLHEVSANLDGTMHSRYVDDETGQVTILNVSGQ